MGRDTTVVMSVYDPDSRRLEQTMSAIDRQTQQPASILIVDATPGGSRAVDEHRSHSLVSVLREPGVGIGEARRIGTRNATTPYITDMDEDDVLKSRDYFERVTDILDNDSDVAGVGGRVEPFDRNVVELVWAPIRRVLWRSPITFRRDICPDGQRCYPADGRGEDYTLTHAVRSSGRFEKVDDLVVETELPTTRTRRVVGTGAVVSVGLAAAAVAEKLFD